MRATRLGRSARRALLALAASASAAQAQPTPAPKVAPPPFDPAAVPGTPAMPDDAQPAAAAVRGYVATWLTPWNQDAPNAAKDLVRVRFAIVRVDARPARDLAIISRLALTAPGSPLLDLYADWRPRPWAGISVGQLRLPLGAAATTLAPQLVLLDRPGFVTAMTKLTFRDVGVLLHSGPQGLADGLVHVRLAYTGGGGRAGVGPTVAPDAPADGLMVARVQVEPGRDLGGPRDRVSVGLTYAREHAAAIATGDAARDKELANSVLGRALVPFGRARTTQLAGADATVAYGPLWAQAEAMYLHSRPDDPSPRRAARGASLELAYTLPGRPGGLGAVQLAGRGEIFDPNVDVGGDALRVGSLGANLHPAPSWRVSLFTSLTRFEQGTPRTAATAAEVTARLAAAF